MGQMSQVNAKCHVVMKLSISDTRTETHTHKTKPIHPRVVGCKYTYLNSTAEFQKIIIIFK